MKKAGSSFLGTAVLVAAGLYLLASLGVVDLKWPWENANIMRRETTVAQPTEAKVVEIEPVALDCRARIHAIVPVEGRQEHKMLGQTYRTDTVRLDAVGDIDTCVDASQVDIVEAADGTFRVTVPAEAITFERPRVNAIETMDSVHYDEGFVGKLTDILPWVSDNTNLTPAAYAYAQTVIGSSECMAEAFAVTEQVMIAAYQEQLTAQGEPESNVEVRVIGEPNFGEPVATTLDGMEFEVGANGATCSVDDAAFTADPEPAGAEA
jgi:hypothetical protein